MDAGFYGGTAQQRQWVKDAIHAAAFPFDALAFGVTFTWGEPPVANHSAFACTQRSGSDFTVTLRPDLDAPSRDPLYTGKPFYMETVVHELGHCIQFTLADSSGDHNAFCSMFGAPTGAWAVSAATPQAWESAVVEAVAETFKDLALSGRRFDNRTRWRLPQERLADFSTGLTSAIGSQDYPGPWA